MAKTVILKNDVTLNDTEYPKGTILSVSDEIYDSLVEDKLAEEHTPPPKGK